ncbi:unnamed protein product [Linum trigynum]|uniref:Uncharacterized protein n=1 Tax=Linum trigynum TaxID=586398 RepID=A0AAV2DVU8_9ROSI
MGYPSQGSRERTPDAIEGEGSESRHPCLECALITKRDLFKIIEDQDEAIEILKREVEALKKGEGLAPSPTTRKRERIAEMEGESGQPRRATSVWLPNDHNCLELEGRNGWMPGRLPRHFTVRQPLARNVLMEPIRTNILPLPTYDGTTDPDNHLNSYFTKMQLYNS